jgi:hypothetical protein
VAATIGSEFLIRIETEVYDLAAGYCGEQTRRLLEKTEQLAPFGGAIVTTHHREIRLRGHLEKPTRAVLRMAAKAPVEGRPHQEFCGEFWKYLDNV